MNPKFYEIINNYLSENLLNETHILDIGCAEIREYSEFLINKSTSYVGLDKSEILIEKAKLKCKEPKCKLLLENVEDLTMPNESFDIIVCNNMLAYTDQKIVLDKIFHLLKKNGLCISFNNNTIAYSLYKIINPFKPWYKELAHSLIVIVNTWLFNLTGKRFFRTIYNTKNSLLKVLKEHNYQLLYVKEEKTDLPYRVINFYYKKNV